MDITASCLLYFGRLSGLHPPTLYNPLVGFAGTHSKLYYLSINSAQMYSGPERSNALKQIEKAAKKDSKAQWKFNIKTSQLKQFWHTKDGTVTCLE